MSKRKSGTAEEKMFDITELIVTLAEQQKSVARELANVSIEQQKAILREQTEQLKAVFKESAKESAIEIVEAIKGLGITKQNQANEKRLGESPK